MKVKKKNILDIINKYDWACSLGILVFIVLILRDKIIIFYNEELSIIDYIYIWNTFWICIDLLIYIYSFQN